MNKQSNTYTVFYIILVVVVVGTALAFTAMSLKEKQQENANADKMRQILAAVHITPVEGKIQEDFNKYIIEQLVIDTNGNIISNDAFGIDVAKESKIKDATKRKLPVYVCRTANGETKYILPVYGAGLWGPVWGYVSVNDDGSTIYGAYFAHQGETPGLGAEIETDQFSDQFINKQMFVNETFHPIAVVKKGQRPANGGEYVDGISGGTITSKGVNDMLNDCISPYKNFLKSLNSK